MKNVILLLNKRLPTKILKNHTEKNISNWPSHKSLTENGWKKAKKWPKILQWLAHYGTSF